MNLTETGTKTKTELNEYLAENMFGLVKDRDFGEPKEFCCKEQAEHFAEYGHLMVASGKEHKDFHCCECGADISEYDILLQALEDYTENYYLVLDKLLESHEIEIQVYRALNDTIRVELHRVGGIYHSANAPDLGTAICMAAYNKIKFDKSEEVG